MIIKNKIILSGGGTGGSVTPLLQIYHELRGEFDFLFVGTYSGLEKDIIRKEGLAYRAILSGKWRRYFSLKNLADIFLIFLAFWQSLFLLLKIRPSMIISVGGFVAVPLSLSAWILRIPSIVHQQDVLPGLANKLMAKTATVVTVTFPEAKKYYGSKAKWIGNLGPDLNNFKFNKNEILDKYQLSNLKLPLIIIMGGGTGSSFLNKLTAESLAELLLISKIIHISGSIDRDIEIKNENEDIDYENYLKLEFIDHVDLLALMSLADLVVSRCGLATLTELSFFKKPAILIPIPNSHQEYNAQEFKNKEAAIVLNQKKLTGDDFIREIKLILNNSELKNKLSQNIFQVIKNGNYEMINLIREIINSKK
jgi:UDP-N-acetylglucosamine--N-acetylmuramyl-(pentapeptide) pyrophosphoryl-undecaprenol N-acetylglucosamine transferase